jgi:hypothetical protein
MSKWPIRAIERLTKLADEGEADLAHVVWTDPSTGREMKRHHMLRSMSRADVKALRSVLAFVSRTIAGEALLPVVKDIERRGQR